MLNYSKKRIPTAKQSSWSRVKICNKLIRRTTHFFEKSSWTGFSKHEIFTIEYHLVNEIKPNAKIISALAHHRV